MGASLGHTHRATRPATLSARTPPPVRRSAPFAPAVRRARRAVRTWRVSDWCTGIVCIITLALVVLAPTLETILSMHLGNPLP